MKQYWILEGVSQSFPVPTISSATGYPVISINGIGPHESKKNQNISILKISLIICDDFCRDKLETWFNKHYTRDQGSAKVCLLQTYSKLLSRQGPRKI